MSAEIQKLYIAYFNRPADPGGLAYWADQLAKGATMTQIANSFSASAEYQAIYTGKSNLVLIDQLYQNLFGRPADIGGLLFWNNEMLAGRVTITTIASALSSGTTAGSADNIAVTSKITAASNFTSAIDTAAKLIAYSGSAATAQASAWLSTVTTPQTLATAIAPATLAAAVASSVAASTVSAGSTFTLTTGVNPFNGTSGNDSFDGSLTATGAQTWQSNDALAGGAGNDTLTATLIGSVTPATMTSIETVNITAQTNPVTVNLTNATGVTNVNSVNSTSALTISGFTTAVKPGIYDTNQNHTLTLTGVTGSADAETVDVAGISGGTLDIAGIELLTLNAINSASTIATLTTSTATNLIATGTQALTITAGLANTISSVTAASKTAGGLTVTMGSFATPTIVGGAGNDSFTIDASTGAVNVSGGAGNDTITAATNLTIADTINGGDGIDTLSSVFASVSTAGYTTPTTRTITGIETLLLTDAVTGALTAVGIDTGITTVTMGVNGTNTSADVTFNAGASTLNIGSGTSTAAGITTLLTVNGSTANGDNITIRNNNLSTANAFSSAVPAAVNITSTNLETMTLNTGSYATPVAQVAGTVTVTGSTGFQAAETLVITGANILTLGAVTADIIDASAMTAGAGTVLTLVTGTTAQTITGSAGNDVLVADTTNNVSVNGGAGADNITGGAGNDTLLGGIGNDVITSGAGNDSVDAGAGDDSLTATLNAADTLIGGDGTDTLTLNIIATAANAVGVSGWETIEVIAGTQTMAAFASTNAISRINVPTGTTVITNAGAAAVTLGAATTTTAVTFGLANGAGTADALTFVSGSTTDPVFTHTALTADTIETLTLGSAAAAAYVANGVSTITTLAAAALTTLNITGRAGYAVTNAITGATGLVTVTDTHTGSGALTLNLSTSTGAVTFTGGPTTGATTLTMGNGNNIINANQATTAGNYTVTGGSGNDSMTGGFGNDSFSGGSGADTLIGGAGADTLSGGAGNDSMTGGDGVDQFSTDSGADTMDGGAGTDVLTLTSSFTDISVDTITSIETLTMGSNSSTMTVAQHTAFTTINTPGAITLSDAGTVAGKTNVTVYNLAAGTNTFTASSTALDTTVTGGTGSDTFNFGITSGNANLFSALDIINGGDGTDTVNITGNIATGTITLGATTLLNIENLTFANTDTAVTIIVDSATLANGQRMTIDGSSGTTGVMTFNAGAEAGTGAYNLIGGNAADVLTGGVGADTIAGGIGADFITNQASGAAVAAGDVLTGGAGIDTFTLIGDVAGTVTVYTGAARVTDFVQGTDLLRFDSANASYTTGGLSVDGTAAGASGSVGVVTAAINVATDSGGSTTNELIKLTGTGGTVGVAFTTDVQGTFNAAIGTGTITNLTDGIYLVSFFDTTNLRAVFVAANTNAGVATTLETADAVRLIGTVDMTQAAYNALTTTDFANFL